MTTEARTISVHRLHALCADAFLRVGMSADDAEVGGEVLSTTDGWGVATHGSKLLRGYLTRLLAGGLRATGRPSVEREGPSWAIVDGDSALGMVTSVYATQIGIDKARRTGMAYVGVRNSCHFGAAGYYAMLAARQGMIAMSMANDIPSVAAPGSRGAVIGSNPLAYAIPAGRHPPILLDMSVATVAGGKVYAARERGESIPAGWLVDEDGLPTVDANAYPEHATLTPAAAHKGYALALLVEGLAGCLSGAATTWGVSSWMAADPAAPTHHGAAFVVMDAGSIAPDLPARVEALVDEVHAAPCAVGTDRLYVPGEIEWGRLEKACSDGVPLPTDVVASLAGAAALVGLDLETYLDPT